MPTKNLKSENSKSHKTVFCPQCRQKTVYSIENAFRPFCSERCKQIDLGAWASEEFRIPTESMNPYIDEDESDTDLQLSAKKN